LNLLAPAATIKSGKLYFREKESTIPSAKGFWVTIRSLFGWSKTSTEAQETPEEVENEDQEDQEEPEDPSNLNPSDYRSMSGSGYLWKPISDPPRNKLVVLLEGNGQSREVKVMSDSTTTVEKGQDYGVSQSNNRPTYRFNLPGGDYPKPCLLSVGGELYFIEDGANRYE
jgi:hypothetical protein